MSADSENKADWAFALQSLQDALVASAIEVGNKRKARDQYIRRLITEGRSMYSIAKVLDISQQSVRQIRDAGR